MAAKKATAQSPSETISVPTMVVGDVARLVMIVDFSGDNLPNDTELEEVIDTARCYGQIRMAFYEFKTPISRSLI